MKSANILYMDKVKMSHRMARVLKFIKFDYSIFPTIGIWYAEDRLYVMHVDKLDAYFFEKAGNPYEAIEIVLDRLQSIMKERTVEMNDK